jgi:hypothetical protein
MKITIVASAFSALLASTSLSSAKDNCNPGSQICGPSPGETNTGIRMNTQYTCDKYGNWRFTGKCDPQAPEAGQPGDSGNVFEEPGMSGAGSEHTARPKEEVKPVSGIMQQCIDVLSQGYAKKRGLQVDAGIIKAATETCADDPAGVYASAKRTYAPKPVGDPGAWGRCFKSCSPPPRKDPQPNGGWRIETSELDRCTAPCTEYWPYASENKR